MGFRGRQFVIGFNFSGILSGMIAAALLLSVAGCNRESRKVEKPVEVKTETAVHVPVQPAYPKLPPPTGEEIKQVLDRVFSGALVAEQKERPTYIMGDFNGDGSEDLAIWVRPVEGRLAEINDGLANWTIVNPRRTLVPDGTSSIVRFPPAIPRAEKVEAGDLLLAMIHGFTEKGWRDPKARQAYLLRQVQGRVLSARHVDRLPGTLHSAEVIFPQRSGFVYWAGGTYAWKQSSIARF